MLLHAIEWVPQIRSVEAAPIPGYPGYFITEFGVAYSLRHTSNGVARQLRQGLHHGGYPQYGLYPASGAKRRRLCAHTLVALAFLPPRPGPEYVIRHKDGNPKNNHYSNLEWGTQADNIRDKIRHGTVASGTRNGAYTHPERVQRGSDHWNSKLTDDNVILIRQRLAAGESCAQVARELKMSKSTIHGIKAGRGWTHLSRQ